MDPFVQQFERLAREAGDDLAVWEAGRATSRGQLQAAAEGLAQGLAGQGIGPASGVSLAAPPGAGFLAAYLALRRVGACVLLLDPGTLPAEEQRIHARLPVQYRWRLEPGLALDKLTLPEPLPAPGPAPDPAWAALKLSSGSSGLPVGIAAGPEHLEADGRQILASLGIRPDDRALAVIPLSHSYGFSVLATPLFLQGTPLYVPGFDDPWPVAQEVGATFLPSVPAWFRAQLRGRPAEAAWCESLRLLISAGAPLTPELAAEWRVRTGRSIHVLYGSSECGSITFDRRGDAAERGTVGSRLEGVRVELVGEGEARHVRVRSAAVVHSYVPADPSRASRLAPGTFDTEDLAQWDGDELRLRGRRSAWINVNGKKVDPAEVEQAIRGLAGVDEVVVLGRPLPDGRGESVRAVVACPGGELGFRQVSAWCRERLAPYKVPRSIVVVPSLPRTERGKLDRRALLALQPDPSR